MIRIEDVVMTPTRIALIDLMKELGVEQLNPQSGHAYDEREMMSYLIGGIHSLKQQNSALRRRLMVLRKENYSLRQLLLPFPSDFSHSQS